MNKLLLTAASLTFLATTSYASSTIIVPVPKANEIAAKSELKLNLNSLVSEVPYMVTCSVNSSSSRPVDVALVPELAKNGGFGVTTINGKAMAMHNNGQLQSGENKLSFMASINKNDQANFIKLKNLDDHNSITVAHCDGQPVSNVKSFADRKVGSGYFYVYNHLPVYLDISVGNWTPTSYCIPPYYSYYIWVSTNNQNISVDGTHIYPI